MRHAMTLLAVLAIGLPSAALAQSNWFPLDPGRAWSYSSSLGGTIETAVGEAVDVAGVQTTPLESLRTVPYTDHWLNFWTADAAGDVYLHGFRNITGGLGVRYDPPILWIAADPGPSMGWEATTTPYDLDSGEAFSPLVIQFTLVEDVAVSVPAGSFVCRRVTQSVPDGGVEKAAAGFDLLGARRPVDEGMGKTASSILSFAPNVGRVKEYGCCPTESEELLSLVPMETDRLSFGGLKASFVGSARLP